jgi:hypothetical protein
MQPNITTAAAMARAYGSNRRGAIGEANPSFVRRKGCGTLSAWQASQRKPPPMAFPHLTQRTFATPEWYQRKRHISQGVMTFGRKSLTLQEGGAAKLKEEPKRK